MRIRDPFGLRPQAALAAAASIFAIVILAPAPASAKATAETTYTLDQTYNAALRLIRVDMGLRVTERDPKAAYVLFDYRSSESGSRTSAGSIEMVSTVRGVRVLVQLTQMPRYHEQVLLDGLRKKLREEFGDPPSRPSFPPPPSEDGGTDDGGELQISP